MNANVLRTQCCIAGAGPAGIMLAYLLARGGVDVIVLEKHADFFRDFRGDTIHPSTLQVMDELGLLDDLLKIQHSEAKRLSGFVGTTELRLADFSHVPGRSKFIALMPQWDFLNFLTERARAFMQFRIEMNASVCDVVQDRGRITGVIANLDGVQQTIYADLVVAADGRHSILRERAGMEIIEAGAPMDVLWMRISRTPADPNQTFGFIRQGGIFVMINRNEYYQCGLVIRKGGFDEIRSQGIPALHSRIAQLVPFMQERVGEIHSWDDVKLLTVAVDRLKQWYRPGFICIGDSAHAMSPIGGVGINLAIQDAVAAANILAGPLRASALTTGDLRAVQARREFPTRMTQGLQVFLQNRVIRKVLAGERPVEAPSLLRLAASIPWFRRIPAYVLGVGFRPEHVSASIRTVGG